MDAGYLNRFDTTKFSGVKRSGDDIKYIWIWMCKVAAKVVWFAIIWEIIGCKLLYPGTVKE